VKLVVATGENCCFEVCVDHGIVDSLMSKDVSDVYDVVPFQCLNIRRRLLRVLNTFERILYY